MFGELALTLNAQFYRAKPDAADANFHDLLSAATQDAVPGEALLADEFRVTHGQGRDRFRYSLRVFKSRRPVYFLPGQEREDHVHAFILVLEIDDHIVIAKKSCASISDMVEAIGTQVGPVELWSSFDDDEVAFQKLSVKNITVSDKALRARAYEAADLKGLVSTHAAGRSIPYFLRVRSGRKLTSFSLPTARVFDASVRQSAVALAEWARQKIAAIKSASGNKRFMASFAAARDLHDVLQVARPASILIESGRLQELLSEGGGRLFVVKDGVKIWIDDAIQDGVLKALERVFEIEEADAYARKVDYKILKWSASLRVNKASLSIRSKLLRWIHVELGGEASTLQALLVKEQLFSVCFDNPRFMYFMGQCFEDVSGVSQIDSLLDMLYPKEELIAAKSEKGEPIRAAQTRFNADSIFDIVERLHAHEDYLFCDDMGIEWADHIALNRDEGVITFIHSKHGKTVTTSASKLHDVVGQGIKNLGNMFFTTDQFMSRYEEKIGGWYEETRISRKRAGRVRSLRRTLQSMLASYGTQRRCVLACSFMSKAAIEHEFRRVGSGQKVRGHVVQLLWILSSFLHAAKELSVEPRIYCRP